MPVKIINFRRYSGGSPEDVLNELLSNFELKERKSKLIGQF